MILCNVELQCLQLTILIATENFRVSFPDSDTTQCPGLAFFRLIYGSPGLPEFYHISGSNQAIPGHLAGMKTISKLHRNHLKRLASVGLWGALSSPHGPETLAQTSALLASLALTQKLILKSW